MSIFARVRASGLFRRDVPPTTAKDLIGWWESRRIPFNLIVGSAGILTCIVSGVVALTASMLFNSNFGIPNPPGFALIAVFLYAIMANVCYTGGWIVEIFIRRFWPHEADRFATSSFFFGLLFSVLLTLTPGIVIAAGGFFGLAHHAWHVFHKI
jgi:hypothetical protein